MNKLQWNCNRNSNIFIQENAFESVVCEMAANLSGWGDELSFVMFVVCSLDMYLVHIADVNVVVKMSFGNQSFTWPNRLDRSISTHDDVIKRKLFPRYWPFVRGINRWPVNSPHKGQWRRALMFSFICALNKRLSKQLWGWWFEAPSRSLWRHRNGKRLPSFVVNTGLNECCYKRTSTKMESFMYLCRVRGSGLNVIKGYCGRDGVSNISLWA